MMTASSLIERGIRDLYTQGYTVFERAWSDDEVDTLRGHLVSKWEELGRPALQVNPPVEIGDGVTGPAGLTFPKLATRSPELASLFFKPFIIDTIRGALGDGMRLELVAGVLSDKTRPFFDWHVHIDGVDDEYYNYKRPYRRFSKPERVTHLLYLDDLCEDNGELLVLPRKISDPTEPPYERTLEEWPDQVEIRCPRGSVVILEQCIWHAARPMRVDGLRCFIGSYFVAEGAKMTPIADRDLVNWGGTDELFRSVVPRA